MSDETGTVRIFEGDPERVVSVTVGELQKLCEWAYGCGHDFVGMSDATVHELRERTCSMDAIDTGEMADYDCSEHIMHCKNCDAEFGYVLYSEDGDVSMYDKPKFCPECGARVVGE